jgi:predicted O-methyltransferase YrrM
MNEIITIVEPQGDDGNIDLDELAIINAIVQKENPQKIFEIGTFDGRTTLNMSFSSKDNCKIYSLDLKKEQLDKTKFELGNYDKKLVDKDIYGERILKSELKYKNKIKLLYGDSAIFDFTPFYDSIELVFVDGAHDYRNALNDSETALKLIGNLTGVIIWHDYKNGVPVVNAIEAFRRRHPALNIYHINGTSLAYCKIIQSDF